MEKSTVKAAQAVQGLFVTQHGLILKHHLGSAAVLGLDAPPCQGTASRNLNTTGAHSILLPQISALL